MNNLVLTKKKSLKSWKTTQSSTCNI